MKTNLFFLVFAVIACVGAITAPCARAAEEEQRLQVVRNGVQTTLLLPVYRSQGVPYASFNDIARQLGASVEIGAARAVFRLDGQDVSIGLEDDQLQTPSGVVALRHPVRGYEGDALIAIADLVPALRGGFGFGTPEEPATTSALALENIADAPQQMTAAPDSIENDALDSIGAAAETPLDSIQPGAVRPLSTPVFASDADFLLAIDPGHGGDDTGVVGAGGLAEKTLCLAVAERLRRILKENYGIATIITREDDASRNMESRQSVLSRESVDLVLSIHGGTSLGPAAQGPMVFGHSKLPSLSIDQKPGLRAAEVLARAFSEVGPGGLPPVYEVPLALLRESNAPGVLVELGNLSNPEDEARLADAAYQESLASALAQAIGQLTGKTASGGSQ